MKNQSILTGRLADSLTIVNDQFSHCKIIVDNGYYKGEGDSKEWISRPESFMIKFSGPINAKVQSELNKGTKVTVKGNLRTGSYTKADGSKAYEVYIQAYNVSDIQQPKVMATVENSQTEVADDLPF